MHVPPSSKPAVRPREPATREAPSSPGGVSTAKGGASADPVGEVTDLARRAAATVTGEGLIAVTSTEAKSRPGARAQIDLKGWQPASGEMAGGMAGGKVAPGDVAPADVAKASDLAPTLALDIDKTFALLKTLPPAITFFGGARIKKGDPYYELAKDIGRWLALLDVPVRTGAGPGIMTAAAEGFHEALRGMPSMPDDVKAQVLALRDRFHTSISGVAKDADPGDIRTQGFNIKLPHEQAVSGAIDVHAEIDEFPYRKVALYENARGLITFPGGYGTLDELFEVWSLAARGRHQDPLVAFGEDFWNPLLGAVEKVAVHAPGRELITPQQLALMTVTEDPVEVVKALAAADGVRGFEGDPEHIATSMKAEIQQALKVLDELPPAVTFIGGRRLQPNDPTCQVAEAVARRLSGEGQPTRVGGGGAVAASVARGVQAADPDAKVQGFVIADEQGAPTPGVDVALAVEHFVTHKQLIGRRSEAFVALPGGLGTLDEVFTLLCEIQCKKLPPTPVVLVGKDYWEPIFAEVEKVMLNGARKTISPEDLKLFVITDDAGLAADVALGKVSLAEAQALEAAR